MASVRVRIPPLSADAAQIVWSILGSTSDTVDVNELNKTQIDELLVVLEAEYGTALTAERMHTVGEFAAALTRSRSGGLGPAVD